MNQITHFRWAGLAYKQKNKQILHTSNGGIYSGELTGLIGPSGSGKTTTLMMLAGFETPTNGEIYLSNKAISKIPPYEREIGMVFQNYALFPHMTVQENLAFPLSVRKFSKSDIEKKVKTALFEGGMYLSDQIKAYDSAQNKGYIGTWKQFKSDLDNDPKAIPIDLRKFKS